MKFSRHWAMPNKDTFSVPVIGAFVRRYLDRGGVSVDPFARNKRWATHTNDLNPDTAAEYHMNAADFLSMLHGMGVVADIVIYDPPYSPRQISECYKAAGVRVGMKETQSASLYKACVEGINKITKPGSVALCFGWNSTGMGKAWQTIETMLVAHGGARNDTICLAQVKPEPEKELF